MGVATTTQSVLEGLKTQFETRIATAIDDLIADGAPSTLIDPVTVQVVADVFDPVPFPGTRPHVGLQIEGDIDRTELGTPQRYAHAPLLVVATLTQPIPDPVTADADARWYARAIDMSLTRSRNGVVTGLFNVTDIQTSIEPFSDRTGGSGTRHGRRAIVRATLNIKEVRG